MIGMDKEMIDRIAEALYYNSGGGDWFGESEAHQDKYRQRVERVIRAMLGAGYVPSQP